MDLLTKYFAQMRMNTQLITDSMVVYRILCKIGDSTQRKRYYYAFFKTKKNKTIKVSMLVKRLSL